MSLDLDLSATPADVARALEALRAWCADEGVPHHSVHDLALILDEVLANVIKHGYGGGPAGWIGLHLDRDAEGVRLDVRDRAPAFDPRLAPAPDLSVPLGERPLGGLGVHILRTLADEVSYERVAGENLLRLRVRMAPGLGPGQGR